MNDEYFEMKVYYDKWEGLYVATAINLVGCTGVGVTRDEAEANCLECIHAVLDSMEDIW